MAITGLAALAGISNLASGGTTNAQAISDAYGYSNSNSGSYNVSAQDSYNMGNAWTDAETANQIAHNEAELNRIFQAYMANTAYQRAVEDLKKAGLNPILATFGGGANVPTGATAQTFMNAGSSTYGESHGYSEGGSSSESHSENWEHSESTSKTQPAWMKLVSSLGDVLSAIPETYQKNYANARAMAGYH